MTVESPCIKVCRLNSRGGVCEGCYRTADEIARWLTATDQEKRDILEAVALRKNTALPDPPAPR